MNGIGTAATVNTECKTSLTGKLNIRPKSSDIHFTLFLGRNHDYRWRRLHLRLEPHQLHLGVLQIPRDVDAVAQGTLQGRPRISQRYKGTTSNI